MQAEVDVTEVDVTGDIDEKQSDEPHDPVQRFSLVHNRALLEHVLTI